MCVSCEICTILESTVTPLTSPIVLTHADYSFIFVHVNLFVHPPPVFNIHFLGI